MQYVIGVSILVALYFFVQWLRWRMQPLVTVTGRVTQAIQTDMEPGTQDHYDMYGDGWLYSYVLTVDLDGGGQTHLHFHQLSRPRADRVAESAGKRVAVSMRGERPVSYRVLATSEGWGATTDPRPCS